MRYIQNLSKRTVSELRLILFYYTGKKHPNLKKQELIENILDKTVDMDYINKMNTYFKNLSNEELRAIDRYTGIGYQMINAFLRDNIITDFEDSRSQISYIMIQLFKKILDIDTYDFYKNEEEIKKSLTKDFTEKIDVMIPGFIASYRKKIVKVYKLSNIIHKIINNAPRLNKDVIVFRGTRSSILNFGEQLEFHESKKSLIKQIKDVTSPKHQSKYSIKIKGPTNNITNFFYRYFRQYSDLFALKIIYSKKNSSITDKGFISTSIEPKTALSFSGAECCFFRIKIPKGSKCLLLSSKGYDWESELLLPPSKFKITKIHRLNYSDIESIFGKVTYDINLVSNMRLRKMKIKIQDVEISPFKSFKKKKKIKKTKLTKKKVAKKKTANKANKINKTKKKTAKKKTVKTKEKSKP